ncbi:hypothetical protein FRC12_022986 [Ceratobasidium sp. 428]|nr:hypothetical protein FRC12_022986 [Ceratobasidium sp. 428]
MKSISDEFDELGGRQVPPVADPEEEATWAKEWGEQAQRAVDQFGPGSLDELDSVESDYSDRLSHYVNHLKHYTGGNQPGHLARRVDEAQSHAATR